MQLNKFVFKTFEKSEDFKIVFDSGGIFVSTIRVIDRFKQIQGVPKTWEFSYELDIVFVLN